MFKQTFIHYKWVKMVILKQTNNKVLVLHESMFILYSDLVLSCWYVIFDPIQVGVIGRLTTPFVVLIFPSQGSITIIKIKTKLKARSRTLKTNVRVN